MPRARRSVGMHNVPMMTSMNADGGDSCELPQMWGAPVPASYGAIPIRMSGTLGRPRPS